MWWRRMGKFIRLRGITLNKKTCNFLFWILNKSFVAPVLELFWYTVYISYITFYPFIYFYIIFYFIYLLGNKFLDLEKKKIEYYILFRTRLHVVPVT